MTWLRLEEPTGDTPLQQVLGVRPDLERLLGDYYGEVWAGGRVDPVVLELCRLRIAQLHGDTSQLSWRHEPAVAAGLTEAKVAALPRAFESVELSEHERACVTYAEKFAIDVHSVTDADAEAVKAGTDDAGFVAFTIALGLLDGLGRLRLLLDVDPPVATGPDTVSPPEVPAPAPGRAIP